MLIEITCEQCGEVRPSHKAGARFCHDKCRAAWHREHDPHGEVRGVRRLNSGKVSITVWFHDHEADRALTFLPREVVCIGRTEKGK